MRFVTSGKVYRNTGNPDVVGMVDREATTVLDVGCGAGDNAALLRQRDPFKQVYGITSSRAEQQLAAANMDACWIADLDRELPAEVLERTFDCIVLSHVLEHLRDPATALNRLTTRLNPGGSCVIAVPNVAHWRERLRFLAGKFEYRDQGALDATHLRFFTFQSAVPLLLASNGNMRVEQHTATGNVPLWILRRGPLPRAATDRLDALGCSLRPNLFGSQILIKARHTS